MKMPALLTACLLAASSFAHADSFDAKQVPAEAKWVVHIDADATRSTKLWAAIRQQLGKNDSAMAKLNLVQTITGMRIPEDIHDVTLFGHKPGDQEAVVVIHATADHEKITNALKANDTFGSEAYGSYNIVTWTDKGKTNFAAFHGKDIAVLSQNKSLVKNELDLLDGKGSNIDTGSALNAGTEGTGLLVYIAGDGVAEMAAQNPQPNPIMGQIDSAWASMKEDGDNILLHAVLTAKSAEAATKMNKTLDGIQAMVGMAADQANADEKTKTIAKALESLTSKVDDKILTVDWPIAMDLVKQKIGEQVGIPPTSSSAATQDK